MPVCACVCACVHASRCIKGVCCVGIDLRFRDHISLSRTFTKSTHIGLFVGETSAPHCNDLMINRYRSTCISTTRELVFLSSPLHVCMLYAINHAAHTHDVPFICILPSPSPLLILCTHSDMARMFPDHKMHRFIIERDRMFLNYPNVSRYIYR